MLSIALDALTLDILLQAIGPVKTECQGCALPIDQSTAVLRQNAYYCNERCADRSTALMIKPNLTGEKYGGVDI